MASYNPETGEVTFYHNTFGTMLRGMTSHLGGWLKILIPLIVLIGGFFIVKKYAKRKKLALIIYTIIAIIVYLITIYLFMIQGYIRE